MSSSEAQEILSQAGEIIQQIEQANIFKVVTSRSFPTFKRSELGLGPILGVGGSCSVREILATRLKTQTPTSAPVNTASENNDADSSKEEPNVLDGNSENGIHDFDAHLDVSTAREFIATHVLRDGEARYAVKKLRTDLSPTAEASAIIDMAIEAKILTVISHPNIIKMRGLADGDPIRKDYFVVLDRLYGTLVDKSQEWSVERKRHKGLFLKIGENKTALNKLLLDRLLTAYDLAAAFKYLHQHNLIYRDIKPENIGFDVRGDVKIFDFGLCKELHPKLARGDDVYKLTGKTGTRPYMAPEVALSNPYGKTADVYSFAVLLWEMLALKPSWDGLTERSYQRQVILGGQRLVVQDSWPPFTRQIMTECLSHKPQERPSFARLAAILRGDLANLTDNDESVLNRDRHMMERSQRSRAESERSIPMSEPSQPGQSSQHPIDGREGFEMMKNRSIVPP